LRLIELPLPPKYHDPSSDGISFLGSTFGVNFYPFLLGLGIGPSLTSSMHATMVIGHDENEVSETCRKCGKPEKGKRRGASKSDDIPPPALL
jgi:hypothetical protein